uniref:Uncharacterized protein n=1 Tax=Candidatus Kentrum sp. FM TaxID=2126340 RepID=A0A450WLL7_9GAMM|nr:MAG: hypothetical protein BECKFM1743A_GA0114220_101777 [Candidatus Kentron sp. FM]VFJ58765.1 MAG: hypothetical protein BECKFM1743C_GA0114222_102333 [Candidatus Kentron sp. FM]VFK17941.1 MAG: hypothetical protein BECKFM1743B_GA0114221_105151 [Candidatus Kentron sp. FM]
MGHNLRGCEKIPSLLRRPPNAPGGVATRFKVCHDWASCSSLHSPILDLVRLASHVRPESLITNGVSLRLEIFSQPLTFAFTSNKSLFQTSHFELQFYAPLSVELRQYIPDRDPQCKVPGSQCPIGLARQRPFGTDVDRPVDDLHVFHPVEPR